MVIPTPFLDQPLDHEVDAPASFFVDLVDNRKNFFLLGPGDQAFTSVMNGSKCYTRNAPGGR